MKRVLIKIPLDSPSQRRKNRTLPSFEKEGLGEDFSTHCE